MLEHNKPQVCSTGHVGKEKLTGKISSFHLTRGGIKNNGTVNAHTQAFYKEFAHGIYSALAEDTNNHFCCRLCTQHHS